MRALVKVVFTCPSNMDEVLKEYSTLRMYLSDFKRTSDGGFISEADVVKDEQGKYHLETKDSLDIKLSLLDWTFNEKGVYVGDYAEGNPKFEEGDTFKFFKKYQEGFKWNLRMLCEI